MSQKAIDLKAKAEAEICQNRLKELHAAKLAEAQHSPLPWKIGRGGDNTIRIYSRGSGSAGTVVAQFGDGIDEEWREHKNAHANAQFILRAVKHADALAEALRDLYEHCAMVHKYWGDNSNLQNANAAIDKGKKALAAYESEVRQ